MTRRVYQAETIAEALRAARRDLGAEATILRTRQVRSGGWLGWLGARRLWEVTAERDNARPGDADGPVTGAADAGRGGYPEPTGLYLTAAADESAARFAAESAAESAGRWTGWNLSPPSGPRFDRYDRSSDATAIGPPDADDGPCGVSPSSYRADRDAGPVPPGPLAPGRACAPLAMLAERLTRTGLDGRIVAETLEEITLELTGRALTDPAAVRQAAIASLAGRIATGGTVDEDIRPGRPAVIALVGPTGVGKTTTLAKLAADQHIRTGRRVALVTMDTYRIAAVEQLRTYASIIRVGIRTAVSAGELYAAVHAAGDADVVLIDTAGVSPARTDRAERLAAALSAVAPTRVHLVLSAGATVQAMRRACSAFAPTRPDCAILTKIDEAGSAHAAAQIAAWGPGKLSYITTGQEVPDDIVVADPEDLAGRIVGEGPGEGCR
jgi:flagellar biosynthesis protein FlhF